MLANLATGSFMVTPLTNTAYLAGWWHMKGKSQALCGKTCWFTTIPAHTGKATRTEMSTDNEATHGHARMHARVNTLLFPHRYNLRQPRITPSSHTNTQIPNPQFCVRDNLYTFIHPFTHGPSAHSPVQCSGTRMKKTVVDLALTELVHRHMSPWLLKPSQCSRLYLALWEIGRK